MEPQVFKFLIGHLEREVRRKSISVPPDRTVELLGRDAINCRQIAVQHRRLTTHLENAKLINDRNGIFVGVHRHILPSRGDKGCPILGIMTVKICRIFGVILGREQRVDVPREFLRASKPSEIAFLASGLAEVQSKRVARRLIVEEDPGRQSHCDDWDPGSDDRVARRKVQIVES